MGVLELINKEVGPTYQIDPKNRFAVINLYARIAAYMESSGTKTFPIPDFMSATSHATALPFVKKPAIHNTSSSTLPQFIRLVGKIVNNAVELTVLQDTTKLWTLTKAKVNPPRNLEYLFQNLVYTMLLLEKPNNIQTMDNITDLGFFTAAVTGSNFYVTLPDKKIFFIPSGNIELL